MRRLILLTTFLTAVVVVPVVWAGSPHFVGTPTVTRDGNSLTVSGKEAGLGNETQVEIQISVQAACLNPGQNFPQAANKETFMQTRHVPGAERQGRLHADRDGHVPAECAARRCRSSSATSPSPT